MSWQTEAQDALKKAGIPITSVIKETDALIVETTDADGETVTIIAAKNAEAVADLLGFEDAQENRIYRVQVGAYQKKIYAVAMKETLTEKGFSAIIKQDSGLFRVQVGAYRKLDNAKAMVTKLKAAGFEAIIK